MRSMFRLQNTLASNPWKTYAYRFLSSFWLIAPVLIPFYRANGLSATKVFIVQSIYLAAVLLFEIPSGYLSDVIGRRKTLIVGSLLLPVGLCVYALSYGFYGFALAEIILGIAGSMKSGTDSALMYDTLLQLDKEKEYKAFEGKAVLFERVGDSIAAVLGGLFALVSLRFPFYLNITSGVLLIPLAISLVEPQRERISPKNPVREMIRIITFCAGDPRIRSVILFSALVFGTEMVGIWSYYLYYGEIGLNIGYFGILLATFGVCSGYGARQAHIIVKWMGSRSILLLLLILSPVFMCLGSVSSAALIPLIFVNAFVWGIAGPLFTDYLNQLVASEVRATVLSINSMAGSLLFVLVSPIFGKTVDVFSLSSAYLCLGTFFLAMGLVSIFLLHRHKVL